MIRYLPISLPWLLALLVLGWVLLDQRARGEADTAAPRVVVDLVCNMEIATANSRSATIERVSYWFCSESCRERFLAAPQLWTSERCLVCAESGLIANVEPRGPAAVHAGRTYRFCNEEHRGLFAEEPARFFQHQMLGIPGWMFQFGVGFLLLISFGLFELLARRRAKRAEGDGPDAFADGLGMRLSLTDWRWFNRLVRSRFTRPIAQGFFVLAFVVVLAAGLFGDQSPGRNLAPVLTWTVWWGGLVVAILFVGKAWCYVCPWDAMATWIDRLGGKDGLGLKLKWPRAARNIWLATILFVGLTWIDIGLGITTLPRATAWLGLAMFGLAFVSVLLFDRRAFCRYGCLVGRVSGLYALFAGLELRAKDAETCATCETKACYRGDEEWDGCPTFEYPRTMVTNTYCILCMDCLRSCPGDNISLNVRPWGVDLVKDRRPRTDEAYLCLLMLSITVLHGLTMTPAWGELTGWLQERTSLGELSAVTLAVTGVMFMPLLVYASLVWVSTRAAPGLGARRLFLEYSYSLLPIALFYHLAHNSEHLLMEGPKVVAFLSDPLGRGWDLFGTAERAMAPLITLEGLWGIQVLLVLVGHVYALWIADRITRRLFENRRRAFWGQVPMLLAMIVFSIVSLWLLMQPMEMRISAM